MTEPGPLILPK